MLSDGRRRKLGRVILYPERSATNANALYKEMKGDIGMPNYEKQVEQEAAYPIPISLLQDSEA